MKKIKFKPITPSRTTWNNGCAFTIAMVAVLVMASVLFLGVTCLQATQNPDGTMLTTVGRIVESVTGPHSWQCSKGCLTPTNKKERKN